MKIAVAHRRKKQRGGETQERQNAGEAKRRRGEAQGGKTQGGETQGGETHLYQEDEEQVIEEDLQKKNSK